MEQWTRPTVSRRSALAGVAFGGAAVATAARADDNFAFDTGRIDSILKAYAGFGVKASGGPGDTSCGEWLIHQLESFGYRCDRQVLDVPAFDGTASLTVEGATAQLVPQAVVAVPGEGIVGRLCMQDSIARGAGDIRIIVLPHRRWSSAVGAVSVQINDAFTSGAAAVVLVTTGPSGEALALNAPADRSMFSGPVAILAPKDAAPFLAAARANMSGQLVIEGRSFRRPAFNVTARLDRGAERDLVLSTPRSGWFDCVGERGPGVAAWLLLAEWASVAKLPVNVQLLCTSGHEYENLGGAHYLESAAPPPDRTALWLHLGANLAARDWHELGPVLYPLPNADPQRYLLATPNLIEPARRAFAGQPGLEATYPATPEGAAGELAHILKAGYRTCLGVFGAHRMHHARTDDLRTVSAPLVSQAVEAFRTILIGALAALPREA